MIPLFDIVIHRASNNKSLIHSLSIGMSIMSRKPNRRALTKLQLLVILGVAAGVAYFVVPAALQRVYFQEEVAKSKLNYEGSKDAIPTPPPGQGARMPGGGGGGAPGGSR
jgi:hypothetical protein